MSWHNHKKRHNGWIFLIKKHKFFYYAGNFEFGINSIFHGLELKFKPFATPELNSLSWISNLMMIITIFGGLFSSINQESVIVPLIIMVLLMVLNIYFILLFFRNYIQIKICFKNKTNKLTEIFGRFWFWGKKLCSSLKFCKF